MLRDRLCLRDVRHDLEAFTGLRHTLQTENFDRSRWSSFGDRLAAVIEHRTHATGNLADDKRIVSSQCALLDQDRCYRATTAIEFRFEHDAGRETRRAGAHIQNVRR